MGMGYSSSKHRCIQALAAMVQVAPAGKAEWQALKKPLKNCNCSPHYFKD